MWAGSSGCALIPFSSRSGVDHPNPNRIHSLLHTQHTLFASTCSPLAHFYAEEGIKLLKKSLSILPTTLLHLAESKQGNSVWSQAVRLSWSSLTPSQAAGSARLFTVGSLDQVFLFNMLICELQEQVLPATQVSWTVTAIQGHLHWCLLGYRPVCTELFGCGSSKRLSFPGKPNALLHIARHSSICFPPLSAEKQLHHWFLENLQGTQPCPHHSSSGRG